jgi:hypothetical protein
MHDGSSMVGSNGTAAAVIGRMAVVTQSASIQALLIV